MRPVDVWNECVGLQVPDVGDLIGICGQALPVFEGRGSLLWLSPNVLAQLSPAARAPLTGNEVVFNLILGLQADFFKAPTNPGITMNDLSGITWAGIVLPCDAQTMLTSLNEVFDGGVQTATNSDLQGRIIKWQIMIDSLTFDFQPLGDSDDPSSSRALSVKYSYQLQGASTVSPLLATVEE